METTKNPFYHREFWQLLKSYNFMPNQHSQNPETSSLKWWAKKTYKNATLVNHMIFSADYHYKYIYNDGGTAMFMHTETEDRLLIETDTNEHHVVFIPKESWNKYTESLSK